MPKLLSQEQFPNGSKFGGGSSFPASPSTDDAWYRTDLGVWCRYDGTRWLGPELVIAVHNYLGSPPFSSDQEILACSLRSDLALYVTRFSASYYTGGGVDGSNYWRINLRRLTSGISIDTLVYQQTTSNNWHKLADKVSSDMSNNPLNTTDIWLQVHVAKTGGPNALYVQAAIHGKYVYT